MSANTLAIFPAKAPVEATSPDQGRMNEDGSDFKSFMDNATYKTDKARKPSKESSTQNQNDTRAQKTKSDKNKTNSFEIHINFNKGMISTSNQIAI